MAITASQVNDLRKKTGAGMMDCKKALVEADGDMEQAIDFLRKKGQKVAAKRGDNEAKEGLIFAESNGNAGYIIQLNCETDFVAKNDAFVKMATDLADLALNVSSKEELLKLDYNGITVEEKLTEQTGVIGEKIEIGNFRTLEAAFVGSYIHAGNKIGVLTGLSKSAEGAEEVAKEVAMQVAAMNPVALNESGVDTATIESETEIAKDQLRKEGKPENMLDKIVKGKIQRFFKDNTLVHQAFIKDSKISVAEHVQTSLGKDVEITAFERVALG
jgi:elongation factor Ts